MGFVISITESTVFEWFAPVNYICHTSLVP